MHALQQQQPACPAPAHRSMPEERSSNGHSLWVDPPVSIFPLSPRDVRALGSFGIRSTGRLISETPTNTHAWTDGRRLSPTVGLGQCPTVRRKRLLRGRRPGAGWTYRHMHKGVSLQTNGSTWACKNTRGRRVGAGNKSRARLQGSRHGSGGRHLELEEETELWWSATATRKNHSRPRP